MGSGITPAERRFRKAERKLDDLLAAAMSVIEGRGIRLSNWSGRHYHYQNERLHWEYWFEAKNIRGSEIEKVTVRISMHEDNPDSVSITSRAEMFQIGKPSRWVFDHAENIPIDKVVERGLSDIVLQAIESGQKEASKV